MAIKKYLQSPACLKHFLAGFFFVAVLASQASAQVINLSANITDVVCHNGTNGAIDLTVTGGAPPYTYAWTNGAATQDITNLVASFYSVTVTDANGVQQTGMFQVQQPPAISLNASHYNVTCAGMDDGFIETVVTGGTAPYSYAWSNGETTPEIYNLAAGNYTLTITDANGCVASFVAFFAITEPQPLSATATVDDIQCNGGNDGAITLNVSGGTLPYSFDWSNGSTLQNQTNLAPGTYGVTITDNEGCESSFSYTIAEPPVFSATSTVTDNICSDDSTASIDITPTGGTAPYTWSWSTGATTEDLTNLPVGSYSVQGTDANGCTFSSSFFIASPPPVQTNPTVTNPQCNGDSTGTIDLAPSGGTAPYNFAWSNGASTEDLSNLLAGTYTVTITDSNGCTGQASVTVTEAMPVFVSGVTTPVFCNGDSTGAIDITITGGTPPYTVQWNNGSTSEDIDNLAAGSYEVTITDANNCIATGDFTITENPPVTLQAGIQNITCNGDTNGAIMLSINGGATPYSVSWSTGATGQSISGLAAGTYGVTVTDANGCVTSGSYFVSEPLPLNITSSITQIDCGGSSNGAIDISVAGGNPAYTYSWSNGATTQGISNLPAGTYSVTVTDIFGCTGTASFTITQPIPITVSGTVTDVVCNGDTTGSVAVTVSGGNAPFAYSWSNGATTQSLSNVIAGTYTLTVTDANNCTATATFTINELPPLSAGVIVTNITCAGDSTGAVNVTTSGGTPPYTFSWSNGSTTEDLSNVPAGMYSLNITDASGCGHSVVALVTETPPMVINANVQDIPCSGGTGSISLNVSGGAAPYSYSWSNGASLANLSNLTPGNYTVTITDNNGCQMDASYTISQPTPITLSTTTTEVMCNGGNTGSISLSVSGGNAPFTYNWSNNATAQNLNNIGAGTYTVTVTDANGCTATATATVIEAPALTINGNAQSTLCAGGCTGEIITNVTGGTGAYTYSWSNSATTANITSLCAGTYTLTVTDSAGCSATASFTINDAQPLTETFNITAIACYGGCDGAIDFAPNGGTPPYTYSWSTGDTTEDIDSLCAGIYMVTVTDANGCSGTFTTMLSEPTLLSLTTSTTDVTCAGDTNGTANVAVTGGTAPYTYNWSTGSVQEKISNLSQGNYQIIVTDANGCDTSATVGIAAPPAIVVQDSMTMPMCHGGSTGVIELNVSGGTPSFSYSWSTGDTSSVINNLKAGTYDVTITEGNGCSNVLSFQLQEPPQINLSSQITHAGCDGSPIGSISVTTGSSTGYQYYWTTGVVGNNISSLPAGSYTVMVVDTVNGCSEIESYEIFDGNIQSITEAKNATCGDDNGEAELTVNGGSGSYIYNWSNNSTSEDIANLAAGTYYVTITDSVTGCARFDTVIVDKVDPLEVSANVITTDCKSSNGSIDLNVAFGTAPYQFQWSNGEITEDLDNISSGTYDVTITDATGCEAFQKVDLDCVPSEKPLVLHNVITPNGDGQNETWVITGIEEYPSNEIRIYNRWGDEVFRASGYTNTWRGESNRNALLPDGTYFYVIHLNDIDKQHFNGYVMIKR